MTHCPNCRIDLLPRELNPDGACGICGLQPDPLRELVSAARYVSFPDSLDLRPVACPDHGGESCVACNGHGTVSFAHARLIRAVRRFDYLEV